MSNDLYGYTKSKVSRQDREGLHPAKVLWFTGLSGSGKSTLAHEVEAELHAQGIRTYVLDGDNIRKRINADLGFDADDRYENIRRVAEIARLMVDAGVWILAAFISPTEKDRALAKKIIGTDDFVEIYCECPIETCANRDKKDLYRRAKCGEVKNFTGISAGYEAPKLPNLVINTQKTDLNHSVTQVLNAVLSTTK